MTGLTPTRCPDGRVGYPEIAEYELTEGPDKGTRLVCPPTFETHPHPDPTELANAHKAWHKATVAYIVVVHDQQRYDELFAAGFWRSKEHLGFEPNVIDNRKAPKG